MKSAKQNINPDSPRGVTLIELLVVVAIISVLTAIMIPRLRVINKDRNIREAARVVGSTMAKVVNRAVDEGISGVIIERNQNFVDGAGVYFAGTRMYSMRRLPPFAGDDIGETATVGSASGSTFTASIRRPLEHTTTNPLVRINDQIRLNHSSVRYRVTDVDPASIPGRLNLRLSRGLSGSSVRPVLPPGARVPYVVYRAPRKLESSRVDLPDGYIIDLRFSGPFGGGGSVFNQVTPAPDSVQLFFNRDGAIDQYSYYDAISTSWVSDIPKDAFYFFVTAYEPDSTIAPLFSPSAMWVTVDKSSGSANVAYNTPPPSGLATTGDEIQYARGISSTRRSANQ